MASVLYPAAKALLLGPGTLGTTSGTAIDLIDDNIKIALIDTADYTYSAAHDFLNDVAGAAIVATSSNLSGKSVTGGVFDATDVTLTSVTGDVCEAIIIYKDTGTSSTSPLIAYIDSGAGLPVTPGGGNIDIIFDSGANKIFAL
jgi:hypothetical protein